MRRLVSVLIAVFVLSSASVASAAAGAPSNGAEAPGRILGIVPVMQQARGGARPTRTKNLTYHNGPVMHVNTTYLIFWGAASTWEANYRETIERYFVDVAGDSGGTSNVYASDTQYYDVTGSSRSYISYASSFGGSTTDTNPYPSNGCNDKATKICLSDAQLQAEIRLVMQAKGWTASTDRLFFIFTPQGVGSCAGSSCAYTNYCAYHSWGSGSLLYANQPYAAQGYRIYTCDSGQHPNGNSADATLNVTSHEHNEAITDPSGQGWYDSSGAENGDKCAWNFGTALGTAPNGAKYNQLINGNRYYLQQEWSNLSSVCVLSGT